MAFGIRANFDDAVASCEVLAKDQLPFTIARALTMLAQEGQQDTRALEQRVFKLRNNWTTQNTKITAATKTTLMSTVYTDTENRATGAKDYLPGQEDGYERVPMAGRQHIAIPTKYLLQMIGDKVIPDSLRPKAMLRYADQNGRYTRTRGKKKGELRRAPATVNSMIFFMPRDSSGSPVALSSGAFVIMARSIGDERRAYPMYLLVSEANVRARFPMLQTVQATVDSRLVADFDRAVAETMTNELLRGTGFRVKL